MIWPSCVVNLYNWPISISKNWITQVEFTNYKVIGKLYLFFVRFNCQSNKFKLFLKLCILAIHLKLFIVIMVDPKFIAFSPSFFCEVAGSDDQCDVLLRYHSPKIFSSIRQWPLRSDNFLITYLHRAIHEIRVDISLNISWISFAFSLGSLHKLNSWVFKCKYVSITILISISLISLQHTFLILCVSAFPKMWEFHFCDILSFCPFWERYRLFIIFRIFTFDLLPYFVRDIIPFNMFSFNFYGIEFDYRQHL